MSHVPFDQHVAELLLRYAKLIVARGYVHNSLGNLAIRVPHPDFPHGVAYTKHAEVSLEEMTFEHVVITDVPTTRLLYGTMPTSVGHNLNREILRLRPDIGAVIHAHHDETIALSASPHRQNRRWPGGTGRTRVSVGVMNDSAYELTNRASRPASSATAIVLLSPSTASATRVIPCFSSPSTRAAQLR